MKRPQCKKCGLQWMSPPDPVPDYCMLCETRAQTPSNLFQYEVSNHAVERYKEDQYYPKNGKGLSRVIRMAKYKLSRRDGTEIWKSGEWELRAKDGIIVTIINKYAKRSYVIEE